MAMKSVRHMLPTLKGNHSAAYNALVAFACIVLATALRAVVDPVVEGVPFMTYFPAVAVAAYFAAPPAGVATMLIGGLVAAYYWVPPSRSLMLDRDAWLTVGIYAFLCLLLILLIHKLDEAARRAQAAEKTSQLYAREMVHRTANLVTLVQAVATMTFKDGGSPEEQRRLFDSRLVALGSALTAPMNPDGNQDALSMIKTVLLPFGDRIHVTGASGGVTPEIAARVALIFHELGTNAVKYGALSSHGGNVDVAGSIERGSLTIDWSERGGPNVNPNPQRRGFGSRLLKNSLSAEEGLVEVSFEPSGLTARVMVRNIQLQAPKPSDATKPLSTPPETKAIDCRP
ncbi:sensor histidine kinase [Ensifer sp. ENS04]|uniref:sensor histidine kinase n=1 Tax=Ensifer sp. ENS04 TaxID=2769281 RepID=UPI0032B2E3B6